MSVESRGARTFYETEALRGGWTYRQLDRQIGTQYWERVSLAKNKAAALRRGAKPRPEDATTPAEEVHDPYVLEFLNLKDEYGESELEEALVHRLEDLLLEMGSEFAFVGRQRRLRIGESWFRIDLLLYHRRLRCLVLVDLKLTPFSAADVGQMNLYVSYAREHWALPGENPPIGLILCTGGNQAVARYALDGLRNPILAGEYRLNLPDERALAEALQKARREVGAARLRSR
jgi:predicted nuclease of restriction endonuclease-like (RecB) superfamily